MNPPMISRLFVCALFAWTAGAGQARAQSDAAAAAAVASDRSVVDVQRAQSDEIEELKRQLNVVVGELQSMKQQSAVPQTDELKSVNGFGPAASKVYGSALGGVSLGGYVEANYKRIVGDAVGRGMDSTDVLRSVIYVGKKFNDKILFNTEFEVENTNEIEVELAQLDFLIKPEFNVRAGLLLAPLGFINEVHEPPYFFGNIRPEPELRIIPSTARENGAGIFGTLGESLSYRAYILNGFNAAGYRSSGLMGGRQQGSNALANDLAFTGRLDWEPAAGLQVGTSIFTGGAGQNQDPVQVGEKMLSFPKANTQLWELHTQYENEGFHFRALYTQANIDDARRLSAINGSTIASRLVGGYAEVAYDVMRFLRPGSEGSLSPFFRYEYTDTQRGVPTGLMRDRLQVRRILVPGIQWKPLTNVVVKIDYRNIEPLDGNAEDELRLGIGLAF